LAALIAGLGSLATNVPATPTQFRFTKLTQRSK